MSKLNTKHAVTIVCAMILVGTEVFAIAIALGWALAGLFELGDTVSYALMSVFSLLGILLMLKLWRQALSARRGRSAAKERLLAA